MEAFANVCASCNAGRQVGRQRDSRQCIATNLIVWRCFIVLKNENKLKRRREREKKTSRVQERACMAFIGA